MKKDDYDYSWSDHWGRWVKLRVKFLGKTLKEIANDAGTAPHNLSRWLASETMPPLREGRDIRLAKLLHVHPDVLPFVHKVSDPECDGFIELPNFESDQWVEAGKKNYVRETDRLSEAGLRRKIKGFADVLEGEWLLRLCRYAEHEFDLWADGIREQPAPSEDEKHGRLVAGPKPKATE